MTTLLLVQVWKLRLIVINMNAMKWPPELLHAKCLSRCASCGQFSQQMVNQMFPQLGRRVHQVRAQEPPKAVLELLIQLLVGKEAAPDQADQEAWAKATPDP